MPEPRRRRRPDDEQRQARSQPTRDRSGTGDNGDAEGRGASDAEGRGARSDSRRHPPIGQLVRTARRQLEDLIGRPVNATLGFERHDDEWQLTVEVVELERIPDTTSILGCYRALVNDEGDLLEYRRIRRYNRSQPDEDV